MTVSRVPDLADVLAARQRIAPYLRPTPLYRYPALDAMTLTIGGARSSVNAVLIWWKESSVPPGMPIGAS